MAQTLTSFKFWFEYKEIKMQLIVSLLLYGKNSYISYIQIYIFFISFYLRVKRTTDICFQNVIISFQKAVTALACNVLRPYQIAIGTSDSAVRLYDRRYTKLCSVSGKLLACKLFKR